MRSIRNNKRGFSQINFLVSGLIGLVFLIIFGFLFFQNLSSTALLGTATYGANASTVLQGNYSSGVNNVASAIPTVFQIGVFVLIVIVLVLAYSVARKSGILGGSGQIG